MGTDRDSHGRLKKGCLRKYGLGHEYHNKNLEVVNKMKKVKKLTAQDLEELTDDEILFVLRLQKGKVKEKTRFPLSDKYMKILLEYIKLKRDHEEKSDSVDLSIEQIKDCEEKGKGV
jgi:polyhydroxyalkanoate synthesis regulator phasin